MSGEIGSFVPEEESSVQSEQADKKTGQSFKSKAAAVFGVAGMVWGGDPAIAETPMQQTENKRVATLMIDDSLKEAMGTPHGERVIPAETVRFHLGGSSDELLRAETDMNTARILNKGLSGSVAEIHASKVKAEELKQTVQAAVNAVIADAKNMFMIEAGVPLDNLLSSDRKDPNLTSDDSYGDLYTKGVPAQKIIDAFILTRKQPNPFNEGKSFDEVRLAVLATKDDTLIATFSRAEVKAMARVVAAAQAINIRRRGENINDYIIKETPKQ